MPAVTALRRARPADADDLRALAALDSAPALTGPVVVASVDGEIRAAMALGDGRVVADPFRRTVALVALLRVYVTGAPPERAPTRRGARATAFAHRWARVARGPANREIDRLAPTPGRR